MIARRVGRQDIWYEPLLGSRIRLESSGGQTSVEAQSQCVDIVISLGVMMALCDRVHTTTSSTPVSG